MKNNLVVKKYNFLESLECVYQNDSTDYLIALRDGLSIIIKQRLIGGCKPYRDNFKGLLKL